MSNLDVTAIRVFRNGKPVSAFVSDLWYLTDGEIAGQAPVVRRLIADGIAASNAWTHDIRRRVWVNEPAAEREMAKLAAEA